MLTGLPVITLQHLHCGYRNSQEKYPTRGQACVVLEETAVRAAAALQVAAVVRAALPADLIIIDVFH